MDKIFNFYITHNHQLKKDWLTGLLSDEAYHREIIDNAMKTLKEIVEYSFPESWEHKEYGYMGRDVN